MPLREYMCRDCRVKVDVIEQTQLSENSLHFCPDCGELMDVVEWSAPAPVRVGKYGKGGGLPPEAPGD